MPTVSRLFSEYARVCMCVCFFVVVVCFFLPSRSLSHHHHHQDVQGVNLAEPNPGCSPLASIAKKHKTDKEHKTSRGGPF